MPPMIPIPIIFVSLYRTMGKFLDRLTGWDHIRASMLVALMVVLFLLYSLLFFVPRGTKGTKIAGICLAPCTAPDCFPQRLRGKNCSKTKVPCFYTIWHLFHFLMHTGIGYFFNIWVSLFVGLGFELHELIDLDMADVLDPFVNTAGCILGASLRS